MADELFEHIVGDAAARLVLEKLLLVQVVAVGAVEVAGRADRLDHGVEASFWRRLLFLARLDRHAVLSHGVPVPSAQRIASITEPLDGATRHRNTGLIPAQWAGSRSSPRPRGP